MIVVDDHRVGEPADGGGTEVAAEPDVARATGVEGFDYLVRIVRVYVRSDCGEGQTEGTTCICDAAAGAHSALGARGPWRRD